MATIALSRENHRTLVNLVANRAGVLTPGARQSFLENAGLMEFAMRLNFDVDALGFSQQLIRKLQEYGTLEDTGRPALVSLLRELRELVKGHEDERDFVDGLLAPYSPDGASAAPESGSSASKAPKPAVPVSATIDTLKILYLAANPRQTTPLRLDEEVREIEGRLREAPLWERINLRPKLAVRWRDLPLFLLEQQPHIVHFAGHGEGEDGLVFEGGDGNPYTVSGADLAHLFKTLRDNVRCVVLNACWSDAQAEAIGAHVDFVIGMTAKIPDPAAIRFAAGFYRGLGFGRDIGTAFELGRFEVGGGGGGNVDRDIVPGGGTTASPAGPVAPFDIPRLVVRGGADAKEVLLRVGK